MFKLVWDSSWKKINHEFWELKTAGGGELVISSLLHLLKKLSSTGLNPILKFIRLDVHEINTKNQVKLIGSRKKTIKH